MIRNKCFGLVKMYRIMLFLFFGLAASDSVVYEDCGSAYNLMSVHIEGCGMWLPCHVTLGDDVHVTVKFYADFISRKLDQDVVIYINYINLRTTVFPEPCETVNCPVSSHALESFTSVMTIPTNIASNQRGFLRWQVYNEVGQKVLCYSVLVQTQSPMQKLLRSKMTSAQLALHSPLLDEPLLWQQMRNQTKM